MPDLNPTLRQTLMDIARPAPRVDWNGVYRLNGWSDELDRQDELKNPRVDFTVQFEGKLTVLNPKSQAAMDWFADHLPEDCPRWGATGYAIETNYVGAVIDGMLRDGLEKES